jgi:hypothetical protein
VIEHRLVLRGTAGAGYDSLLWWVLKMPCLAGIGPDGERCLVLIDSGLGELARVTADVAARQQLPARTRPPAIAWVPRLDLADGVSLREFPASIYPMRWEARLLGLPLWRHSGYVLGLPALRGFAYVEFDNPRRRVTFSAFNAFAPGKAAGWDAYPLTADRYNRLTSQVPLAGQTVTVCPDTGGGPVLILSASDWTRVAPHVRVLRRQRGQFPSWNGFVPCDIYTLDRLTLANQTLVRPTLWVRTADDPQGPVPTLMGLGPLRHTGVVYDFKNMKLWINAGGSKEAPAPRPLSQPAQLVRRPAGW